MERILEATDDHQEKMLNIRRKAERELIMKFDQTKIDARKECWYLIDSRWLNNWSLFVHNNGDLPGNLSSRELIDSEKKILPELKARIDYRGVTPLVFFILNNLYGHDTTPQFSRYTIDIYAPPVPIERLVDIQFKAQAESSILAHKIRKKWIKWEIDDNEDEDNQLWCCCGLQKEHVESIIYWMIMCCSRKKSGRSDIKYTNYKPLKGNENDDFDNDEEVIEINENADKEYGKGAWVSMTALFGK